MIFRFFSLLTLFLRYRLYHFMPYAKMYRVLYVFAPWALFLPKYTQTPLQEGLEKMGPIFIKFGQFLSARSDLFHNDVLKQLAALQDRVRYSDPTFFQPILHDLQERYHIHFNPIPLASASIAHVYSGTLLSGQDIAIKIQRPHLEKSVVQDLKILKGMIQIMQCFLPRRLRLLGVFQRFANTLHHEMDFKREAAQADALKAALSDYKEHVEIPKIYWPYVTKNILVLQRAPGVPFHTILHLECSSALKHKIAKKLYLIFLHSVFKHGLFHADMHPGNIFFDFSTEKFWFVDFGIVARLDRHSHKLLCQQIVALFKRDYVTMAQAFIQGGWTPENFSMLDRQNFEWSLHMLCAPLMDKKLCDISLAQILQEMMLLARTYHIRVQPEMILLQKTLFVIEGLVRSLDPQMNLIEIGSAEVLKSVYERYGLQEILKNWLNPLASQGIG